MQNVELTQDTERVSGLAGWSDSIGFDQVIAPQLAPLKIFPFPESSSDKQNEVDAHDSEITGRW